MSEPRRINLRVDAGMHAELSAWAGARDVSLNTAVVRLLERGLLVEDSAESDRWADVEARLSRLEELAGL